LLRPLPPAARARAAVERFLVIETISLTETPVVDPAAVSEPDIEGELAMEHEPARGNGLVPAEIRLVSFAELGLSEPILHAVQEKGYLHPTPIQEQAIPVLLSGRDVLGAAQTGTGKTAGFTLPMLDILAGTRARARMPRSLILEPTRELALQVADNFLLYGKYLKLTHALLIGGESVADQREVLQRGVDVLIATPGRLLDMFERGGLLLSDTRILVIDEADRMLDMGFIPDVERIVGLLPRNRQTALFSATLAPEIRRIADAFLQNPREITVAPPASVAATIAQGLVLVAEHDKREALRRLIRKEEVQNALIFCNRKRDVDILYRSLKRHNFEVGALHGDMSQPVRFATLEKFRTGEIRLLVCSDVAARGLDIVGMSHVFNFDVPHHAEDYVHRIGRTGRAGRDGCAFTLATSDDRLAVEAVEALIGMPIPRLGVEGLDPVGWREPEARRGRGRRGAAGGRSSAAKPNGRSADAAPAKSARAKPPSKRSAPRTSTEARAGQSTPARAKPPADGPARRKSTEAEAGQSTPARARVVTPTRRGGARAAPPAAQRVHGFGEDVPAFMRIEARPRRPAPRPPEPPEGAKPDREP
jgi:superfamily II DNA/RNA helicase